MDYKKMLDENFTRFKEDSQHLHDGQESCSELKAEFLASDVLGLTTYDSAMDYLLVSKIMDVVHAIDTHTTFEYIKDKSKYIDYITCVNMPWFKDKLNWGSSIRGAWWDNFTPGHSYISANVTQVGDGMLYYNGEQVDVKFSTDDSWKSFIKELINFWYGEEK